MGVFCRGKIDVLRSRSENRGVLSRQNRGFGSSTNAVSCGGYDKITGTEVFNGSSWSASGNLNTGRKQFAASNNNASGITSGWVGGGADGDSSVEHFTPAGTRTTKTLTTT